MRIGFFYQIYNSPPFASKSHKHTPGGSMNTLPLSCRIPPVPNAKPLSSSSRNWLGTTLQLLRFVPGKPSSEEQASLVFRAYSSSTATNFVSSPANGDLPKVYASHVIYKGKSAMSMNPGKPAFKSLETGDAALDREGCMFLEFAPAVAQRQYDWKHKQIFALSVLELGTLVALLPTESCEFYHDPYMGKSDAGKVRKSLRVEPIPDKSGFFFNLSVSNKLENFDVRISIPVTRAEFTVMKSAFNFIIPYLMGWHALVNPLQADESMPFNCQGRRPLHVGIDPSLEWEK